MLPGFCLVSASYISSWSAKCGGLVGVAVLLPSPARAAAVTLPLEPGGRMFHRLPYDGPDSRVVADPRFSVPSATAAGAIVATSPPAAIRPMIPEHLRCPRTPPCVMGRGYESLVVRVTGL